MSSKGGGLLEPKAPADRSRSRDRSRSSAGSSRGGKSPSPISWSRVTPSEALHKATELGDADAVARVLRAAPDAVDSKNGQGRTALHNAAQIGRRDVVEVLLKRGADVNARSYMGFTALTFAAEKGHTGVMLALIQGSADLDVQTASGNAGQRGHAPLHKAVLRSYTDAVHLLLLHGARVDVATAHRITPLHIAVQGADKTSLIMLSAFGADPTLQNAQGDDAFAYAQRLDEPRRGAIQAILQKWNAKDRNSDLQGAEVRKGGISPFVHASGTVDLVAMLCSAAETGKRTLVEYVLDLGGAGYGPADLATARNPRGWTALHCAAKGGEPRVALRLLQQGAPVDIPTRSRRWTPLLLATERGRKRTVALLLDHGADLFATTDHGVTALDLAYAGRNAGTLLVLAQHLSSLAAAPVNHNVRSPVQIEYLKAQAYQNALGYTSTTAGPPNNALAGGRKLHDAEDSGASRGKRPPKRSAHAKSAAKPATGPSPHRPGSSDVESSSDSASDSNAYPAASHDSLYLGTFDGALSTASPPGAGLTQSKTFQEMIALSRTYLEYKSNDRKVKIAVLDTGLDMTHRDWQQPPALRFPNDKPESDPREPPQRDRIKDYQDFCGGDTAPKQQGVDLDGHGTQVAGILLRLAPRAEIYVARVCVGNRNRGLAVRVPDELQDGRFTHPQPDVVATAIHWAIEKQVDIINMSFGFSSPRPPQPVVAALKQATKAGILVFAAMSNDGNNSPEGAAWPARDLKLAIGVHSCREGGMKTSDFTPPPVLVNPNLMAVGEGVITHWPEGKGGGFRRDDGTSFSTPVVAAMAALILAFVYQSRCWKERAAAERDGNIDLLGELHENWTMARLLQSVGAEGENRSFCYVRPRLLWAKYWPLSQGTDAAERERRRACAWEAIRAALDR